MGRYRGHEGGDCRVGHFVYGVEMVAVAGRLTALEPRRLIDLVHDCGRNLGGIDWRHRAAFMRKIVALDQGGIHQRRHIGDAAGGAQHHEVVMNHRGVDRVFSEQPVILLDRLIAAGEGPAQRIDGEIGANDQAQPAEGLGGFTLPAIGKHRRVQGQGQLEGTGLIEETPVFPQALLHRAFAAQMKGMAGLGGEGLDARARVGLLWLRRMRHGREPLFVPVRFQSADRPWRQAPPVFRAG